MNMNYFVDDAFKRLAAWARIFAVLAAVSIAAACAGNDEQETTLANDLTESYQEAKQAVANSNYRRGIQIFEAIQARFRSAISAGKCNWI